MTLDLTKPANSTPALSSEIRENFTALAQSLGQSNLIPNGNGVIWPTATMPGHFLQYGTNATTCERTTGTFPGETHIVASGSGDSQVAYSMAPTSVFDADVFSGVPLSTGEWVKTSAASAGRLFIDFYPGGVSDPDYSAWGSGAGTWEWLTVTATCPANATRIIVGRENPTSKEAWYYGLTGWFGAAPPQYFVPCEMQLGTLFFPFAGSATTDTTYEENNFEFAKPAIVFGSRAICRTAPVTTSFTWNVGKLTTAETTYSALYTSDLAIAAGSKRGDASTFAPTTATYANKCFDGRVSAGGSLTANNVLGVKRTAAGGTAAVDVKIMVVVGQFSEPLVAYRGTS
jgi:hypothetical protein